MLLAGFTESGTNRGFPWVFDAVLSKPERRTPKGVAWETDYYTIDIPGEPPDFAEQVFGSIENAAAPVIREKVNKRALPARQSEAFANLRYFLALMYVRVPRWRQLVTPIPAQMIDLALSQAFSTPERWAATQEAMKEAGYRESGSSYDELKKYIEGEGVGPRIANPGPVHVQQIAGALKFLPQVLAQRNWCLLVAADSAPDFVSSDCPASLVWSPKDEAQLGSVGLGFRETEVAFAVHRRLALLGMFETIKDTFTADARFVADINWRTARYATRYVYGPEDDFTMLSRDARFLSAADWFAERKADQRREGRVQRRGNGKE